MMVLDKISYFPILGLPFMIWIGILAFLFLLFTASISAMNKKGIHKIPMQWHMRMAAVTIVLASIHVLLAILARF